MHSLWFTLNNRLKYDIRRKELEKTMTLIDEFTIQKTFKNWCDKQDFILSHWHVPNGFTSNPKQARLMKMQGLRPGVWDYWVILNNGKLLVIEFKTEIGKLSKEQIEFENVLFKANIPHIVARSSFEAANFVKGVYNGEFVI